MKTERRHFKERSETLAPGPERRSVPGRIKVLLVVLWLILMGGISHSVMAQCTLTVLSPDQNTPDQLPIGANCELRIDTNTVIQNRNNCNPGSILLTIRDEFGSQIFQGFDEFTGDFSPYVGQVISVTVVDTANLDAGVPLSDDAFFAVVNNRIPAFVGCTTGSVDTVIACTADTSISAIGIPEIIDDCGAGFILDYTDEVAEPGDCLTSNATLNITRTWTVENTDGFGSTCTQNIILEKPNLTGDIEFPGNVVLSCENPIAHPDTTGYPLIDSIRLSTNSPCDIVVTFHDDTTATCMGVGMTIVRKWTVIRRCDDERREHKQLIDIVDDTAPTIVCPDDFTISTTAGECAAILVVPEPMVTDACDPNALFTAEVDNDLIGTGPFADIQPGPHFIVYTGMDACGNTSTCTTNFTVVDSEQPTAVCDDNLRVSLTDGGVAIARAISFDEGSNDNCSPRLFYKALRMDIGGCDDLNGDDDLTQDGIQEWFDDFVFFCCEDKGVDSLRVRMRTFTVDPGRGAVDPTRMESGDLFGTFNECMVFVQLEDKVAPEITCPANDTVECTTDFSDLSIFGSPIINEGCIASVDSFEVIDLDNCQQGLITRSFTVVDDSGNRDSCSHTILVTNPFELADTMITWPVDVDTNICGGDLLPEMLPDSAARPSIDFNGACEILSAVSYTDTRFDISYPACYKIIRRWTVIDWCALSESGEGRFSRNQIIKVQDVDAPTLNCISDIRVSTNNETCDSAIVRMDLVSASDACSPSVRITNDSEFADDDAEDATGIYPLGTTAVTFTASDNCGNFTSCTINVTVEDNKAPSPICIEGLVATLHDNDTEGILAVVQAQTFLVSNSLSDNCHDPEDITISIRKAIEDPIGPPTGITELQFSCSEVGSNLIELWVTDENGNSDYCITHVDVQDNNAVCPQNNASGFIAGNILTEGGKEVEEVLVSVMDETPFATITGVNGEFSINGVAFGNNLTIVPEKDDEILNGVSTMDMILISKHILGLDPLDSPYAIIAADIDGNGKVSTLDLIKLRKLILNKTTEFPDGNSSWRFIDADYVFPNGQNPLTVDFPEFKEIEQFSTATGTIRFVAVKIGDINGSVRPNTILKGEGRTTNGDVVLQVKDREFESGETFTVEVASKDLFNLIGFQFTLDYDERLIELVDLEEGDLPKLNAESFGTENVAEGLITASWNEQNDVLTIDEGNIVRLTFRAIRSGDLFTALELKSQPTLAEAYNYNQEAMQMLLQFVEEDGSSKLESDFRLYQNYPNPFSDYTKIGFVMPKNGMANLSIYSVSGRMVYNYQGEFARGYNEIELSSEVLNAHGIYYFRLETDEFNSTRKMIHSITK